MVLALCCMSRLRRYLCLPVSSLLAEQLKIISAPASVRLLLGGTGAHMSSHISTPNFTPSVVWKMVGCAVSATGDPAK